MIRRFTWGFPASSRKTFARPVMVKLSTKRYFADRNTKWDDLFETSNTDEKKERRIPPTSSGSSTYGDEDAGWYDYNPGDDGISDIEMDSSVEEILRADGFKAIASNYHEEVIERSELYTDPSTNTEKNDVTARPNVAKTANSKTLSTFPKAPSNFTRVEMTIPLDRQDIFSKKNFQNNGGPIDTDLNQRKDRLRELEQRIFEDYNDGKEFNLNSPKQISTVLFGTPNESTNKNTLESLSTCNDARKSSLADLILTYRKDKQAIKRLERKENGNESGKSITSFFRAEKLNYQSGAENNDDDPLLLIDASSYIFRAYYSMPPLHRHDGMPVGAVMGFCNMLNRVLMNRAIESLISANDDEDTSSIEPARVIMVFDAKGKNFRHDLYPEYKANRPPCPIDLIPQFDLIHEAAKAYGIPEVEAEGFEADDVIATLATSALTQGINTHILSSDKDLMQLVVDKNETSTNYIHMMDPQSMSRIDKEAVMDKWNVSRPEMVGDLLALSGDSADNIPGVPVRNIFVLV